ncbi:hypothetical protein [Tahibacter amnicola]|uniref:Uncharacterized protein n=1 Tax=Tahibacter amnicola TaxID=2976241 RepID=A0ABY6BB61_9GAMM|nr:hypothetical protein [Tahibacter amnicola]UXI67296.1 hypothetical protein N4264_21540 [Tahibacter amnicola]
MPAVPVIGFISNWDPCAAGWCNFDGGNNDEPDDVGSGGGSGSSGSNDGGDYTKVKARAADNDNDCTSQEEWRLAAANARANLVAPQVEEGDFIEVRLSDGMVERWEYVCGGRFCAGTVLAPYPVKSMCRQEFDWWAP